MEKEKRVKICPGCGKEVPSSRLLCPHCGYSFPSLRTCPDCGEDCLIDEEICLNCGHDFVNGGKNEEFLKEREEAKREKEEAEAKRKEEEEARILEERKRQEEEERKRKEEEEKAAEAEREEQEKRWRDHKKEFQNKIRKRKAKKRVILTVSLSLAALIVTSILLPTILASVEEKRRAEEEEARFQASLNKMNEDFANPDNFGMSPRLSEDGSTLTYGLYPQSVVNDSSILDRLNNENLPTKEGMSYLDGCLYAKKVTNPFSADSSFDDKSKISSAESYWFEYEPIEWNVLKASKGIYTLVSSYLLDTRPYAETNNDYEESEVRAWLNDDFYHLAFLLNSDYLMQISLSSSSDSTGDPASDSVYLLSYDDYLNEDYGFSSTDSYAAKSRRCKTTEWARANGAWASLEDAYFGYGRYWTRSASPKGDYYAQAVDYNGSLGVEYVATTGFGIRLAVTLKL